MKLNRIVIHGTKARNKMAKGANFLADSVKITLGPFGQNWFLDKKNAITNDGAKIAQEIVLKDEVENRGVVALREATRKTNDEAGDGTTTATTLAQAIYAKAVRLLGDEEEGIIGKITPAELIRQIETERKEVEEKLIAMAEPIETEEQLIKSAIVSVEDPALGKLIGETQFKLGKEAVLLAEETAERSSSIELVAGIRMDNGLGTAEVINNQEKQQLEVEDSRVILTNQTLQDLGPLQKVIEQLSRSGVTTLTIVARAFTSEAIQICLKNINNAKMKIYPLNAPYVDQAEIMKDLAAVLGGTFFHSEERAIQDMQISDVGYASKIVARRYDAVLAGKTDDKSKERIAKRIEELHEKLKGSKSDFEKKALQSRIAQLQNGFGIVRVGSDSELERRRLFDKCEDGVNAVRAAYQEGVVPGAGLAFKTISESLPDTYLLKQPLLSIYEQIKSLAPSGWEPEDWVKDPVKVLRIALKNACLAAGTFATAGGVITAENVKPRMVEEVSKQEEDEE